MASRRLWIVLLSVVVYGCVTHPIPTEFQENCAADDPRVGQVAELTNRFIHGVRGTARIVDNCTIVVENFYYDGIAADARWIGVQNLEYEGLKNAVILSGPQMRAGGYVNETIEIKLPEGVTLDDVPIISLCCLTGVDYLGGGSLGDGVFQDP